MKHVLAFALVCLAAQQARAMCGGMISRPAAPTASMTSSNARITNQASKVVLVREGDKTTLVMSNDFDGDVEDFALFVPVPVVVNKGDVKVLAGDPFAELERASTARVTTLHEVDPCPVVRRFYATEGLGGGGASVAGARSESASASEEDVARVVVKSEFAVGPFNVVVLSAGQSQGLVKWLTDAGYKVGDDAAAVIDTYLKQGMFFFVAEANAKALKHNGRAFLPPLSVRFQSPKLGLPIRLGMMNADGPQELLLFTLADGRVEPTNYRSVRAESEVEVPAFAARRANETYAAAFKTATAREGMSAVFTEYVGGSDGGGLFPRGYALHVEPMAIRDVARSELEQKLAPCGAPGVDEVVEVTNGVARFQQHGPTAVDPPECIRHALEGYTRTRLVFRVHSESISRSLTLTRLHFTYDKEHFPEDLAFQVTSDRKPFRILYRAREPYAGPDKCAVAKRYRAASDKKLDDEIAAYAKLTGMSADAVRSFTR